MKNNFYIILLTVMLLAPIASADNSSGNIIIKMTGLRNNKGDIKISLFKSEEGFPDNSDKALKKSTCAINKQSGEVIFKNIPFGEYAVSFIHDENLNGDLDSNWMGIPVEGFGASNDPESLFGPPKFKDASFKLNAENLTVKIKAEYY